MTNVAAYQTSFLWQMCMAFKVGISSFGEPLYLGCKPAHAICSIFASEDERVDFTMNGNEIKLGSNDRALIT